MDSEENNDRESNIIGISDDDVDTDDYYLGVSQTEDIKNPIDSQLPPEKKLFGFVISEIVSDGDCDNTTDGLDMVSLLRDKQNPNDRNAIKVVNGLGNKLGYIEKEIAAVLAPLIDIDRITVTATVPGPRWGHCRHCLKLPVHVHIYSPYFWMVHYDLSKKGLHKRIIYCHDDGMVGFSLEKPVSRIKKGTGKSPLEVNELFDLENEKVSVKVLEKLKPPRDIIRTELLPHQEEGLGWLVERETSNELPPFWKEKNGVYVNVLIDYHTNVRPLPWRGGILADDMGLGKTLTLLSLIAFDKPTRNAVENESLMKTTLIVCPPSVISGWVTQIEEHTYPGSMKMYMFYGGRRTDDPKELEKYDVVLTTYATLASEISQEVSPLKQIEWWRLVLDEAHVIKNFKSQQSQAVNHLKARMRWAVTGTPIQNGFFDLFAFVLFLRYDPFSLRCYWRRLITRPIAQQTDLGLSRLKTLIALMSLRRTKEGSLLGLLPEKSIETCYVELSSEERELYNKLYTEARSTVTLYYLETRQPNDYCSVVLSAMIRLRQACIDMALLPPDIRSLSPSSYIEDVKNKPKLLKKLVAMLQEGEDIDCAICIFPITNMVITSCAHVFCQSYILKALKETKRVCPLCRHPLTVSDIYSSPPELTTPYSNSKMSSKVSQLLKLLRESRDENPSRKSVIFSQFRKMLILLEEPLRAAGFKFLRLDCSMNAKKRGDLIREFDASAEVKVMLASMKSSGAGINLTAASRLYLLEPWWNPGAELQAMDRVHRIGQKEKVKIVRLIAKNTIEQTVLELQESKKCEATGLLDLNDGMEGGRVKIDNIRALLSLE